MSATFNITDEQKREYVIKFIHSTGYDPIKLSLADIDLIFGMLSREDEYKTSALYNGHNWETSFSSLQTRSNAFFPVIDLQLKTWARTGKIINVDSDNIWPEGKSFALCLTHDIDILHEHALQYLVRAGKTIGSASFRQQIFIIGKMLKYSINSFKKKKTPPLEAWLKLEDRYGFKSTLNFMANNVSRNWDDGYYFLSDVVDFEGYELTIAEVIEIISKRGWDIGLHGGSNSYIDATILRKQKDVLEKAARRKVTSTRQHHLYYDVSRTSRVQIEAGLTVDSTLGSNQDTVFRCGTGFPFLYFDRVKGVCTNLLEIPLVVQDVVLANIKADDEALMIQGAVEMIEQVAAIGGCITLLWHNQYLPGTLQYRVYEAVLSRAAELNAWGCSMNQLETLWRERL